GLPQQNRKDRSGRAVWDMFPLRSFHNYQEMFKTGWVPIAILINRETLEENRTVGAPVCIARGSRALVGRNVSPSLSVNARSVKLRAIAGCIIFSNDDVSV